VKDELLVRLARALIARRALHGMGLRQAETEARFYEDSTCVGRGGFIKRAAPVYREFADALRAIEEAEDDNA